MGKDDVKFALNLTRIERWSYNEDDFRRLIIFEPEGCFMAWKNGKRIGMVTATSYEDYAFLGCLIVIKEERGKGIGTKLMEHAINYLNGKGVKSVELDGVFPAVSMYRRLGFKDKYLSLRFLRRPEECNLDIENSKIEFKDNDKILNKIVNFDKAMTGIYRERVIRKILEEFKDSLYISDSDKIKGYSIVRERSTGNFTPGPIVALNNTVAEKLLSRIASDYGNRVLTIGVPEINSFMIDILLDNGFVYNEPSVRMYMGERMDYERHIYGILSPEKG
jgi:GNAT superfamily N-acetyltransferase